MLSLSVLTRRWSVLDPVVRAPRPLLFSTDSPRGLWLLALLLACFAIFSPRAARADVQEEKQRGKFPARLARNAPPSAVPLSEEIDPGEQIGLTLESHGAGGRSIEFDFASQPKHGQLTGFHITGHNTAVVTYVHDIESGPGQDQFTYRVRAAGMPVSAPVAVDITIHDFPPRIAMSPAELDFGAVNVGQESRAQLTMRNEGGGQAVGRLEPPLPWVVEGNAEFRLNAGEKQVFKLVFRPQRGRSFSESFIVGDYGTGNQRPANLHLLGTGLGPDVPEPQFAGINGVPPAPIESAEAIAQAARKIPAGKPVSTPAQPAATPPVGIASAEAMPNRKNGTGAVPGDTGVGGTSGADFEPPPVALNEAGVRAAQVRSHGRTNVEITWRPPQPLPSKYRVELRYLSLDHDDNLQVEWEAYAKVDFQTKNNLVTATVRDLPAGTSQSIRVVAVDGAGRSAAPSGILHVQLDPPLQWWRLSFLQWLLVALLICGGLVVRNRLENRQILRDIDAERVMRRKAEARSSVGAI